MAEQQVLKCPVCGKSGALGCFNIAEDGSPLTERAEHISDIGLRQRDKTNGRVFWTKHEVPLKVKVALRRQLVETLMRLEAEIAEEHEGLLTEEGDE